MKKILQVGILGAGYMGQVHGANLVKIKGVRIAAICSEPLSSAEDLARKLGLDDVTVTSDFNVMLKSVKLDVLYVCIPPFAHQGQFEAAAKKGIHIFIEKPIARDVKRGEAMVTAAKKGRIFTQVGYHMRYGAAVQELARLIANGTAGKPTLMDARYECNSPHGPWWRDRKRSGGQVFEQIIHLYDIARWVLGEPAAISAFTANQCHKNLPDYTVEDTSAASIRFKNGALANITGTNCAVPMEWNGLFTIVCEKLTAHFMSPNKATFIFTGGKAVKRTEIDSSVNPYEMEDRAFIAAVMKGRKSSPDIADGLASLKMVNAVMTSGDKGGLLIKL